MCVGKITIPKTYKCIVITIHNGPVVIKLCACLFLDPERERESACVRKREKVTERQRDREKRDEERG